MTHRSRPLIRVRGNNAGLHVRIQSKSQGLAATPNPRMVSNQRYPTFLCSLGCPFSFGSCRPLNVGAYRDGRATFFFQYSVQAVS